MGVVESDVTGYADSLAGDPVRSLGAVVRRCSRFEWSDVLATMVCSGIGYRAVFRDGERGPIRKTYADASRDARNGITAPRREDAQAREGTGS